MTYFKTDLAKTLRRRSTIITFIVMMLIIFVGNFGFYKTSFSDGVNYFPQYFPLFLGLTMIIAAVGYISFALGSSAITDEQKERGYIHVLECGYRRELIVIVKYFEMVAVCLVFFVFGILFHSTLSYLFFGWNISNTIMLLNFLKLIVLSIIPISVIFFVAILMYLLFKTEFFAICVSLFVAMFSDTLIKAVNFFLKIDFLGKITAYFPAPTLSKISKMFSENAMSGSSESISLLNTFIDLKYNMAFNLLFLFVIIAISIFIVKRKDFD